jgi:hypothetical protein
MKVTPLIDEPGRPLPGNWPADGTRARHGIHVARGRFPAAPATRLRNQ